MPQAPESLKTFFDTLHRMDAVSVVDILLIAVVIFVALLWLKGSSGMSLVRGAAVFIVAGIVLGSLLNLTVVNWLLRNSVPALLVAVPIVFQPEIRRALERVGRTRVAARRSRRASAPMLAALNEACHALSARRLGALIVVERETGLDDYLRSGTIVDAIPTVHLIVNLFWRNAPLHDGAVILREGRVMAAGCTLPLSDAVLPGNMGTRHRAALGISERTDAVVVVVSEETGAVSVAVNGQLFSGLDADRLRTLLQQLAGQSDGPRAAVAVSTVPTRSAVPVIGLQDRAPTVSSAELTELYREG
jgi:diadenylate cyclase